MKIIRIRNCEECVHVYTWEENALKSYLVCGDMNIYKDRPAKKDRIVKKTKIPKWCILEEDNDGHKSTRTRTVRKQSKS